MSNEWAQMLAELGIVNDTKPEVAVPKREEADHNKLQLVDLTHIAVLEITGEDALPFLQGQFCNDLTTVSSTRAQITGYCTPKGRLLALPIVVGMQDGVRLLLPHAIKEAFVKRLGMFIMRSKVVIQERTDWLCTGVILPSEGSASTIDDTLGALPGSTLDAATSQTQQVIRWHDYTELRAPGSAAQTVRERYIVLTSEAEQLALWQKCPAALKQGPAIWRYADIIAGVPSILPATAETFVPQMVNLQLIDALSFTKGCYPGQEIVARMQYLGKLKRHMRAFTLTAGPQTDSIHVQAGDSLSSEGNDDAGIVVDAVRGGDGSVVMLAVVKVSVDESMLQFAAAPVTALPLPYELPSLTQPTADAS